MAYLTTLAVINPPAKDGTHTWRYCMIYDILFTDGNQTRTWHAREDYMTDILIELQCDGHRILKISKNHYCEVFDYTNMSKFMHLPAINHPAQGASGWWEIHQETSDQLYTRPSGTYRIS